MVPGVAVDNIKVVNLVEVMLLSMGGEYAGHSGIKAATEQSHDTGFPEPVLVGPLPVVLKLGHVARLIVGRVQVVHPGFQAGVHDSEVLVGQSHVDDHCRFELPDECDQFGYVVGIHRGGLQFYVRKLLAYSTGNGFALADSATGQQYLGEHFRHSGAFVRYHVADSPGSND